MQKGECARRCTEKGRVIVGKSKMVQQNGAWGFMRAGSWVALPAGAVYYADGTFFNGDNSELEYDYSSGGLTLDGEDVDIAADSDDDGIDELSDPDDDDDPVDDPDDDDAGDEDEDGDEDGDGDGDDAGDEDGDGDGDDAGDEEGDGDGDGDDAGDEDGDGDGDGDDAGDEDGDGDGDDAGDGDGDGDGLSARKMKQVPLTSIIPAAAAGAITGVFAVTAAFRSRPFVHKQAGTEPLLTA